MEFHLVAVREPVVVCIVVGVGDAVVVAVHEPRIGPREILAEVRQAVAVGIARGVGGIGRIQAVDALPAVGHAVAVAVGPAEGGRRRWIEQDHLRRALERGRVHPVVQPVSLGQGEFLNLAAQPADPPARPAGRRAVVEPQQRDEIRLGAGQRQRQARDRPPGRGSRPDGRLVD